MFQIGNERVALVTDTSCDLSDEQLSQYDIRTVALRVATSQGEFRDRLEITQEQLYDLLQREVPKTSLPLPEDVSNLYRTLHDEGATSILHLSISGSLSGTFNMVSLLAEDFEDMKIHVFDSKTLSCGLGLLVLEAAESLQNGMSVEDTIALLEKRREHQLGAFVIRTLEFLRKGGRIGRVEGAIGSLLQIKPVIYVNDEGVYNTLCKARGFSNALTAMVDEIIRRCNIHNCEQTGIVGRMGAVYSVIENNHIHHINNMQELGGAEISGIKLHAAIDVVIRRNHIHDCTMGVWCDWEAQGTRITQNLLHHNERPAYCTWAVGGMESQDIFVEVGHGPTLIDNNIMMSKVSLRFATQGVALVHNLMLGTFTCVGGGTSWRYTPYHIRHRTEVAGFMTILHGDDRFYNNIFVQAHPVDAPAKQGDPGENERVVGTWCFDDYPTEQEWLDQFDLDVARPDMGKLEKYHFGHLPVWADGNAYFAGAKPWKKEKDCCVKSEKPYFMLVEREGQIFLDTDVAELIGAFRGGLVDSDTLGRAFEPDQRFEAADGSTIVFDSDFYGNHRGARVLPGPFATLDASMQPLF